MTDPVVPSPRSERQRRLADLGLCAVLLVGLLTPTSHGGDISRLWVIAGPSILAVGGLLWFSFVPGHAGSRRARLFGYCVVPLLLLFSLLRPASQYTFGTLLGYLAFTSILWLDLRGVTPGPALTAAFNVISALFLVGGCLIVVGFQPLQEFLLNNYSAYRPGLLEEMVIWSRKPVLTFATHSVAGFFLYLFAYLHARRFRIYRRPISFAFAASFVILCALLTSVTGVFFAVLGLLQLCRALTLRTAMILTAVATLIIVALLISGDVDTRSFFPLSDLIDFLTAVLLSPSNGFLGRYSGDGNLVRNMSEITTHPLSPIGIGYPSDWLIGDSGPLEYVLRGSVPLLLCMYAGLWFFLAYNLRSRKEALHLFAVTIAFELGFTILTNARLLYFVPPLIVLLNEDRLTTESAVA